MYNKYFTINQNDKFIIYGVGHQGQAFYKLLKNNKFDVIAFLDKRADIITNNFDIPILFPENNIIKDEIKENAIIIITTINFFEHYIIAEYLNTIGYKKILYKLNIIKNKKSFYTKKLNSAYEQLLNGKTVLSYKLPKFNSKYHLYLESDLGFIKETDKHQIVAYIPVEMLFVYFEKCNNFNKESNMQDKSMYMNLPFLDLFNVFEGKENYTIDNYIKFSKMARPKNVNIDFKEEERSIFDRYRVYNQMSLALNLNKDFFIEQPVKVRWNKRGYFNIIDGLHRVAFLLSKNINRIPCEINKNDYMEWINKQKLNLCIEYIKKKNIRITSTPIIHPYFYFYPNKYENCGKTRLSIICRYLEEKNIDVNRLNVINIGSNIGYFAQHFYRMGADVTCVEKDSTNFELSCLLNKLFYCDDIKMINKDIREINNLKKYEIVILISVIDKYIGTLQGLEILKIIDNISTNIMFWESGYEIEEEKTWILKNSKFKKYEKLQTTFRKYKQCELGVFYTK